MKLSNAFSLLTDLRFAVQKAFLPTLLAIWKSPVLLVKPHIISRIFFYHVWFAYGEGADIAGKEIKRQLITPYAKGVILDLGAGLGHTALYLTLNSVKKYIALEPNLLMHSHIRETALRAGFSEEAGTLLILSCGAGDIDSIAYAVGGENEVDTIVSVLTLCSVPNPQRTIDQLVRRILKPGGQLLFSEHVASKRSDVRWWQKFWSPLWGICFDGCVLDRPTDDYIRNLKNVWENVPDVEGRVGIWGREAESVENLFWHQVGRLIKSQN